MVRNSLQNAPTKSLQRCDLRSSIPPLGIQNSSIALMGGSMGGLNAATVMIQQPSLLQGVFLNVSVIDILRGVRLSGEARGVDDIGDPEVPAEFDFMANYAPLENVNVGEKYPAVLLRRGIRMILCPRGIVVRLLV
jgi:prolyl oligopeptidase PreP (S9A serine peptidase family)